jgi:outer membrane receptor protein involved in Fe transport
MAGLPEAEGSWGQNGNATAPAYTWAAQVLSTGAGYNFGTGKGTTANSNGAYPSNIANLNLGWETSEQIDLGFDASFLHNRLNLNFDYYRKNTKDWVVQAPVIATAGADAPYINGGDVKNRGFEVALNWNDRIGRDFRYNLGGNLAYNHNEVGELQTADGIIHGTTNVMFNNQREFYRISEGHAMGTSGDINLTVSSRISRRSTTGWLPATASRAAQSRVTHAS